MKIQLKARKILFLSIIFIAISVTIFCQEDQKTDQKIDRNVGLSASIQSSQYGIMIPFWLSDKFVLAPAFDFKYVEKVTTDFSIGIVPRFYFKTEKVSPYLGFKFGAAINKPSSKNTIDKGKTVDILAGVAFGAEYFFDKNFSVGIEAEGNFTKSDENSQRFGNPGGVNFNTATMVSATIYF